MAINNRHEQGDTVLHQHSVVQELVPDSNQWCGFTFYAYPIPGVFSSVFDPHDGTFTTDDGQLVGLATISDY